MRSLAVQACMKRDGRTVSHRALEAMRLMALERMAEGENPGAVSASFGLHRTWAYKVRAKAKGRGKGKRALRSTRGTGRPRKLDAAQGRQVSRWVNGKNPRQYGFEFALWTRPLVRELIEQKLGVRLSLASVGVVLARQGLTVQKPLQRAYQRDPMAVARWQQETYPEIARRAKQGKADIYFWDESGFRTDSVQGKTWGAKGHTPVVLVPGQRQGISAASAVNAKGGFWFATYKGGLNAVLFVTLLRRMLRGRPKPLHLIVDGLPTHKTRAVRDCVNELKGKLTVHFPARLRPDAQSRRTGLELHPTHRRRPQPLARWRAAG